MVTDMTQGTQASDEVRRFIIEHHPVRGHWVRLESTWTQLRAHQELPRAVRELLGQAVSASVLLAASLKFDGELTLQLHGDGAVRLLVAQCTNDFRVRGVARFDESAGTPGDFDVPLTPGIFRRLVGNDSRFAVTVESSGTTGRGARYQGIVPLTGSSLAECLEAYFASSEQLPTRIRLVAGDERAAGLLLQRMPEEGGRTDGTDGSHAQSAWEDAERAVDVITAEQLLAESVETVLSHGFDTRDLRLFSGDAVRFSCRCNEGRVAGLLRALGAEEVRRLVREQGAVTITCEFCQRPYRFDAAEVERLFDPANAPENRSTLH